MIERSAGPGAGRGSGGGGGAAERHTLADATGQEAAEGRRLDRRRFLAAAGVLLGTGLTPGIWRYELVAKPANPGNQTTPVIVGGPTTGTPGADRTLLLRRREDQLLLRFDLYGAVVVATPGGAAELRLKNKNATPIAVVTFPSQHLLEEALYEYDQATQDGTPGGDTDPKVSEALSPPPVGVRLAGASRLAFDVPPSLFPLPFTSDALLRWDRWTPRVVPVALPPVDPTRAGPGTPSGRAILPPALREPTATETAIELPMFLQLSPHGQSGWVHATTPVDHGGPRTELWHTRLASRATGRATPDEDDHELRVLRAVWTRDPDFAKWLSSKKATGAPVDGEAPPQPSGVGMPFRASVSPSDRYALVISTADFSHRISGASYQPQPLEVDRLHLTSLGATYGARGAFVPGTTSPTQSHAPGSLEAYRHEATHGRDHFVRLVYKGHLLPFGHAASLVKVTERKFHTPTGRLGSQPRRIAYLRQRYYLIVREPLRRFGAFDPVAEGRRLPFTEVRLLTMVTPNLDPPKDSTQVVGIANASEGFVPFVAGAPLPFQFAARDQAGREISGTTPLVFVTADHAYDATTMATVRNWYDTAPAAVRSVDLAGTPVAFAPSNEPGDTWLESHRLTWGAAEPQGDGPTLARAGQPDFLPILARAAVRLSAAEAALGGPLAGPGVAADGTVTVVFAEDYITGGLPGSPGGGGNVGEVFVRLEHPENPAHLDFGANSAGDRAGGVATPSLAITALSRANGPIGGPPADYAAGTFTPTSFFPASAKLLGDITLSQVVGEVTGFAIDSPSLPVMTSTRRPAVPGLPERDETLIRWSPVPQDISVLGEKLLTFGSHKALVLDARTVVPLDGSAASTEVLGDLRDFRLTLFPGAAFIHVEIDQLRFRSRDGKSPDVDVLVRDVTFDGPLTFLAALQELVRFGGGDGPALELHPTHLDVSYTLPLPDITFAVFSLQNLSFTAGLVLPFTGQPVRARFAFATIDDPFLLTVMVFGGGGFFELGIGTDGVESLQVALEFGGSLALDVGVASGSVSVVAGIYLAIGVPSEANPDGACELTGYVRVKGEVDVLGVITATLMLKIP